jgi:hypothetical protein
MSLSKVYKYFRNYDRQSFAVFSCQGNEPSESDIADFERHIGFGLPPEFREFTPQTASLQSFEKAWAEQGSSPRFSGHRRAVELAFRMSRPS